MCKDVSYEMSEAIATGLEMQGKEWRIEHGKEHPDNEYCVRCQADLTSSACAVTQRGRMG